MKLEPKELLLGAGILLLLAVGLCRAIGPGHPHMQPVSVQGLDLPSQNVDPGQTVTREVTWEPPDDVYLIGWLPRAGVLDAESELMLRVGDVRIFDTRGPGLAGAFFPAGSGYVVRKGQRLTLRSTISHSGTATESRGAQVLIYFVPVAGN
jgi:hypothetical protein